MLDDECRLKSQIEILMARCHAQEIKIQELQEDKDLLGKVLNHLIDNVRGVNK